MEVVVVAAHDCRRAPGRQRLIQIGDTDRDSRLRRGGDEASGERALVQLAHPARTDRCQYRGKLGLGQGIALGARLAVGAQEQAARLRIGGEAWAGCDQVGGERARDRRAEAGQALRRGQELLPAQAAVFGMEREHPARGGRHQDRRAGGDTGAEIERLDAVGLGIVYEAHAAPAEAGRRRQRHRQGEIGRHRRIPSRAPDREDVPCDQGRPRLVRGHAADEAFDRARYADRRFAPAAGAEQDRETKPK